MKADQQFIAIQLNSLLYTIQRKSDSFQSRNKILNINNNETFDIT